MVKFNHLVIDYGGIYNFLSIWVIIKYNLSLRIHEPLSIPRELKPPTTKRIF